jgi:hypothetical protein
MGDDSGGGDGGDSGDGDQDNKDDDSSDMPKGAPVTSGALTAGGDSRDGEEGGDGGDNNQDDGSGNSDNDNKGNDGDKVASKTPPKTSCPKGQEYTLFSGCVVLPKKACPTSYSNTEVRDRLVFVADPFLDFEEPCQPTNIDPDSVLPKKP